MMNHEERKDLVDMEIENFILYWTSSEEERVQMRTVLIYYMDEVYLNGEVYNEG